VTDVRVLVANLSAPEIGHLAAELARRDQLVGYVRPYANKGRWWERALRRTPKLGDAYGRTLGRRLPPEGLPLESIDEAGVLADFGAAVLGRVAGGPTSSLRRGAQMLTYRAELAVGRRAGRRAREADVAVASYGTGAEAFAEMKRRGGRSVLNYPIAHNDFQRRFYAEEAKCSPEFAPALPALDQLPAAFDARLEAECQQADRILVGSTFVRDSFLAQGYDSSRIAVVPYGVDTERFSPAAPTSSERGLFRALFVGQIGQRKGIGYLLSGYERFRKRDSNLRLVGSYMPGSEVYDRYRHLYEHTPHVPHAQLPDIYRDADVFVFPTLIEGMPLSVLEAMACGIPVIVTSHGPGDIVTDGTDGFVVPIRDPDSIADRLERLYGDADLRRNMGRAARQTALRYTWHAYAIRAANLVTEDRGQDPPGCSASVQ
jgi:glycosyltransferase involved in cell wall biosynthesis